MWGTYLGNVIMTAFISMVPVVELRGAIPAGVANGLPVTTAMIAAVVGNLIPVPIIVLFVRKVFAWMRETSVRLDSIVARFESKASSKSELVEKYEFFGLILLVAVPLPGTGAWTGALVAAMMEMRLKTCFPAIVIGVLIAGVIVSYITYGVTRIV